MRSGAPEEKYPPTQVQQVAVFSKGKLEFIGLGNATCEFLMNEYDKLSTKNLMQNPCLDGESLKNINTICQALFAEFAHENYFSDSVFTESYQRISNHQKYSYLQAILLQHSILLGHTATDLEKNQALYEFFIRCDEKAPINLFTMCIILGFLEIAEYILQFNLDVLRVQATQRFNDPLVVASLFLSPNRFADLINTLKTIIEKSSLPDSKLLASFTESKGGVLNFCIVNEDRFEHLQVLLPYLKLTNLKSCFNEIYTPITFHYEVIGNAEHLTLFDFLFLDNNPRKVFETFAIDFLLQYEEEYQYAVYKVIETYLTRAARVLQIKMKLRTNESGKTIKSFCEIFNKINVVDNDKQGIFLGEVDEFGLKNLLQLCFILEVLSVTAVQYNGKTRGNVRALLDALKSKFSRFPQGVLEHIESILIENGLSKCDLINHVRGCIASYRNAGRSIEAVMREINQGNGKGSQKQKASDDGREKNKDRKNKGKNKKKHAAGSRRGVVSHAAVTKNKKASMRSAASVPAKGRINVKPLTDATSLVAPNGSCCDSAEDESCNQSWQTIRRKKKSPLVNDHGKPVRSSGGGQHSNNGKTKTARATTNSKHVTLGDFFTQSLASKTVVTTPSQAPAEMKTTKSAIAAGCQSVNVWHERQYSSVTKKIKSYKATAEALLANLKAARVVKSDIIVCELETFIARADVLCGDVTDKVAPLEVVNHWFELSRSWNDFLAKAISEYGMYFDEAKLELWRGSYFVSNAEHSDYHIVLNYLQTVFPEKNIPLVGSQIVLRDRVATVDYDAVVVCEKPVDFDQVVSQVVKNKAFQCISSGAMIFESATHQWQLHRFTLTLNQRIYKVDLVTSTQPMSLRYTLCWQMYLGGRCYIPDGGWQDGLQRKIVPTSNYSAAEKQSHLTYAFLLRLVAKVHDLQTMNHTTRELYDSLFVADRKFICFAAFKQIMQCHSERWDLMHKFLMFINFEILFVHFDELKALKCNFNGVSNQLGEFLNEFVLMDLQERAVNYFALVFLLLQSQCKNISPEIFRNLLVSLLGHQATNAFTKFSKAVTGERSAVQGYAAGILASIYEPSESCAQLSQHSIVVSSNPVQGAPGATNNSKDSEFKC